MTQTFKVVLDRTYTVEIYKSLAGRWCIKHPSFHIHNKDFAGLSYARKFCKRQGWQYNVA